MDDLERAIASIRGQRPELARQDELGLAISLVREANPLPQALALEGAVHREPNNLDLGCDQGARFISRAWELVVFVFYWASVAAEAALVAVEALFELLWSLAIAAVVLSAFAWGVYKLGSSVQTIIFPRYMGEIGYYRGEEIAWERWGEFSSLADCRTGAIARYNFHQANGQRGHSWSCLLMNADGSIEARHR